MDDRCGVQTSPTESDPLLQAMVSTISPVDDASVFGSKRVREITGASPHE